MHTTTEPLFCASCGDELPDGSLWTCGSPTCEAVVDEMVAATDILAADPLAFHAERDLAHLNRYLWRTIQGTYAAQNDGRGWRVVNPSGICIGIEPTLVAARRAVEADVMESL